MEYYTRSNNYYDNLYDSAGKPHFAGHLPGWVKFIVSSRLVGMCCSASFDWLRASHVVRLIASDWTISPSVHFNSASIISASSMKSQFPRAFNHFSLRNLVGTSCTTFLEDSRILTMVFRLEILKRSLILSQTLSYFTKCMICLNRDSIS